MHHDRMSRDMQNCIQQCLECYRHCQHHALTTCLEKGGRHVQPDHFRLMLDCAEACRSAAALMIHASPYHAESCDLCARICRDCADSCRELDGMEDCVAACEACAESCEAMAHASMPPSSPHTLGLSARAQ